MADVEYFWDPACPWSWITSRWMVNVLAEQPMTVDWRFISLLMINEPTGGPATTAPKRGHTRGLELLRVAAAARAEVGRDAVLALYTAFGQRIHVEHDGGAFDEPGGVEAVLAALGYPPELAGAARSTAFDDEIRADGDEALERCGGNIGTPVISLSPPSGPSFFGPVINRAPAGTDAVDLWNAVTTLGSNPHFSELKRSTRGRPQFD